MQGKLLRIKNVRQQPEYAALFCGQIRLIFLCMLSEGNTYYIRICQSTVRRGSQHAKYRLEWLTKGLARSIMLDLGICLQAETAGTETLPACPPPPPFFSSLRVLWYKALQQQQYPCGSCRGGRYCPNLNLYQEVSPERSRSWNNQPTSEWKKSQFIPSSKIYIVSCRWETQETLYIHRCKIKDKLLCCGLANRYPTAKLHCSVKKELFFFVLMWYDCIAFLLGNQLLLVLFECHLHNNHSHICTPLLC